MIKQFTKNELFNLQGFLNGTALLEYRKVPFSYAIGKIRKVVDKELVAINEALKIEPELLKLLDKDVIKEMQYGDLKKHVESSEIAEEPKKKLIDKIDQSIAFLDEKVELELYDLTLDSLPLDLSENHFRLLTPLILED